MMDIKEVIPDFQKLNKTENCIVIHLKTDTKVAITSPVGTPQWALLTSHLSYLVAHYLNDELATMNRHYFTYFKSV